MTPFTALYRKEFREHRASFFVMLGCLALCLLLPLGLGAARLEGVLVPYIYLYGFYVTAIAAMSYAKEEENQTSRFLRTLPVASGTILLAKLAWLGTAITVLLVPVVLAIVVPYFWKAGISLGFHFVSNLFLGIWQPLLWFAVSLFSLISWGYFWTTRYPSKLFATLLSYCCVFITWLAVAWFGLDMATRYYGGQVGYWPNLLMSGGVFLLSVPVTVLGLWRAATFYSRAEPETKPEAFLNSERKDNDRRVRFVTRFFPQDRWTPFQALLWQSICQSRDILFLGLGTAIAFGLWQMFLSEQFFAVMNRANGEEVDWNFYVQILGLGIICVGFLIAFGLGSSIFAQDQERGMYRALGQRGVSPRLVWWSRILPFLAVILVPVPFLLNMFFGFLPERASNMPQDTYTWILFLQFGLMLAFYFVPFCFGTFYSLLFRNVLVSMLATFGTWLLYGFGITMGGQAIGKLCYEFGIEIERIHVVLMFLACAAVPLLFPIASRLMTASWLREEPLRQRWFVPTLTLAVFAVYALGPVTVWGCCELMNYLTGTRIVNFG